MKPGKNFQEIAKGKTISTAFYFNRTRLKSTVRLKLAASTALQPQSFGKEFARVKYHVRR